MKRQQNGWMPKTRVFASGRVVVDKDPTMRESIGLLRELAELDREEFIRDRHQQSSAKYNFVTAIEAAIDIANHVISRKGFRAPDNYADTFQVLAEQGLLDESCALPRYLDVRPTTANSWPGRSA
jgi:uncharacterized protein YutE (UPF0331/DUF86 family)